MLGMVYVNMSFILYPEIWAVGGVDPVRREELIDLLDIDLQWRMHKVPDGQRRRVLISMGFLHPYKVLKVVSVLFLYGFCYFCSMTLKIILNQP
jgi:hypothetical protein